MRINIHHTNIRMNIFKEQINTIKKLNYKFYNPKYFIDKFNEPKRKKILITIDDGFKSFYNEAWPYLKKKKYRLFYLFQQNLLEKTVI